MREGHHPTEGRRLLEGDSARLQKQGPRGEREGGAVPKEEGPGDQKSEPRRPGLLSNGVRV